MPKFCFSIYKLSNIKALARNKVLPFDTLLLFAAFDAVPFCKLTTDHECTSYPKG